MGSVSGVDGVLDVALVANNANAGELPIPVGATAYGASSGNVANAAAVATSPSSSGKTTYVTGFQITAGGATAGSLLLATLVGVIGGTVSFIFAIPAGATLGATPLVVAFPTPLAASGKNVAIVLTLPAAGAGNTNAAVSLQGYQL